MNALDTLAKILAAPIEHRGERVITLPMMDAAHGRPAGTARRNFHENLERLVEGRHFYRVCADEIRTHSELSPKAHESVALLTERGYLVLVKSFRDDLAWDVQERLVEGYFRARSPDGLALAVQALTSALAPLLERVSRVEQLVVQAQALPAQAFIPGHIAKRTSRAITALAKVRTAGRPGAYRAERAGIDTVLRARLGFPAFGCNRWANFPLARVSELLAAIEDLERQAERLTPPPQQALPFPRPA
jgi:hypothetical protein